ncbi:MAG: carbohydrate kinase [Oribacterium sp.]|nr:carbohydrate kinase [Oribacterium sp.]
MEKTIDVVALGELLIDFTDNGSSSQGNPVYEANPGGAPCNVLAMLGNLGKSCAFIGKVGKDMFGEQLKDALVEVGIDTRGLVMDTEVHTTLAFVHKLPNGDRDFSFYRNPGADMMLDENDLNHDLIKNCRVFHFGSLSMTSEVCENATRKAIDEAVAAGAFITFDPNLREPLWDSLDTAKEKIAYGMSVCNMMKISDNEIEWFTGIKDYDEAVSFLQEKYPNIELILLSLGRDGSRAYTHKCKASADALLQEGTVETTGAGDTFCGSMICGVLEHMQKGGAVKDLAEDELAKMLNFANTAASIITTRKGALRVMPKPEEVNALLQ